MASRTSSSRRAGSGRSSGRSSPQKNNQMPMILGGAGLLVVILALVMFNKGGGDETPSNGGSSGGAKPAAQSSQPAPVAVNVEMSAAKSGKTPERAAPPLTQETLTKMETLYAEAKAISDAGIKLQNSGQKMAGSAKQAEAKVKIDAIKALIEGPSGWYEEADFGGWAVPAEYATMNKIYGKVSTLEKTIRMNGGK